MKLIKVSLVSLCAFSLSAEVLARSSVSSSRSSVSVSRPSVSTTRSYSRPVSKPRVVSTSRTQALKKRNSKVEYDYYALNDCQRIIKPVNGYRCIDRD